MPNHTYSMTKNLENKKMTTEFIGTIWLVLGECRSAVLAAGLLGLWVGFVGGFP